jgi:hypothetical protein
MSRNQPKAMRDLTKEGPPSSSTRIAAALAPARGARPICALRRTGRKASFTLEAACSKITAVI